MKTKLKELITSSALSIKPEGEYFTLSSGAKSRYYLDLRNVTLTPSGVSMIVQSLHELLKDVKFTAIGGPTIGADPIIGGYLVWASMFTTRIRGIRGFLVRKENKKHGKGGRIVGPLERDMNCVIVEDVTTSGGSAMSAVEAVEDFGAKVVQIVSVVDRLAGGKELFEKKGIPFTSLFTIDDWELRNLK